MWIKALFREGSKARVARPEPVLVAANATRVPHLRRLTNRPCVSRGHNQSENFFIIKGEYNHDQDHSLHR